jgi:hypothetical protein
MDSGKVVVTDNRINAPSDGPGGVDQLLKTVTAHALGTTIRVRKMLPRALVYEGVIVDEHPESCIEQCSYGRRTSIVRRIRHKRNLLLFLHSRSIWWFRSRAIRWTLATAPSPASRYSESRCAARCLKFDVRPVLTSASAKAHHELHRLHALKQFRHPARGACTANRLGLFSATQAIAVPHSKSITNDIVRRMQLAVGDSRFSERTLRHEGQILPA